MFILNQMLIQGMEWFFVVSISCVIAVNMDQVEVDPNRIIRLSFSFWKT